MSPYENVCPIRISGFQLVPRPSNTSDNGRKLFVDSFERVCLLNTKTIAILPTRLDYMKTMPMRYVFVRIKYTVQETDFNTRRFFRYFRYTASSRYDCCKNQISNIFKKYTNISIKYIEKYSRSCPCVFYRLYLPIKNTSCPLVRGSLATNCAQYLIRTKNTDCNNRSTIPP